MAKINQTTDQTFGLKSRKIPPSCTEIESFEDLFNMVPSIKFKMIKNNFWLKLKEDVNKIRKSKNMFVFADKTNNLLKMPPKKYQKLLQENVTKTYKKATQKVETLINLEAKNIAKSYNNDDQVECLKRAEAFITLKDHKDNFRSHPTCHLLNPCKSELGKISKCIFEEDKNTIKMTLNLNHWKNTNKIIDWFINIDNKHQCTFIKLDIKDFYLSTFIYLLSTTWH